MYNNSSHYARQTSTSCKTNQRIKYNKPAHQAQQASTSCKTSQHLMQDKPAPYARQASAFYSPPYWGGAGGRASKIAHFTVQAHPSRPLQDSHRLVAVGTRPVLCRTFVMQPCHILIQAAVEWMAGHGGGASKDDELHACPGDGNVHAAQVA